MNEMNPLEKQLESWIPRRPSARLKARLFPAERGAPAAGLPGLAARQSPSFLKFCRTLSGYTKTVAKSLRRAGADGTRAVCAPRKDAPARLISAPPHLPLMAWLTPGAAMCVLLFSLHLARPELGGRFSAAGDSNLLAGLSSNLLVLTAAESGSQRQNLWSSITFEWTKAPASVSTMDSFPLWKTNIQKL